MEKKSKEIFFTDREQCAANLPCTMLAIDTERAQKYIGRLYSDILTDPNLDLQKPFGYVSGELMLVADRVAVLGSLTVQLEAIDPSR